MIMPFGKYKDQDMDEIPSRYLLWAAENLADEKLACEADRIWQERERFHTHIREDDGWYISGFCNCQTCQKIKGMIQERSRKLKEIEMIYPRLPLCPYRGKNHPKYISKEISDEKE